MSNPARTRVTRGYIRVGWVAALLALVATTLVLGAAFAIQRASLDEGAVADGAARPQALETRSAFVAAIGAGDTERFGALWCADPPPGGTAGEIAAELDAEQAVHGPVTGAAVQTWEPLLPRGPSAVGILVEHGTVQRSWAAILVEEADRGWRVCGAGPHAR